MADREDEIIEALNHGLSRIYTVLVHICQILPVPIALPTSGENGLVSNQEAYPAIKRVSELASDQPMPEEQEAQLYTGCIHWLAALDLYGLLVANEDWIETRAEGSGANLLYADEALKGLARWLITQRD
jgi:hypothetical protein